MAESKTKRLLVILQLGSSDIGHIKTVVPDVIETLDRASDCKTEQVFRSSDGTLFGFFMRTHLGPHHIRTKLEGLQTTRNTDHILTIEIGEDFSGGIGFTRAWTWLQHKQAA